MLKKSVEAHRTSFVALKTSLGAAKLELWDYRIQRTLTSYDKYARVVVSREPAAGLITSMYRVVASMNRLAQHLSGVRTAVTMERELDAFRSQQARERSNARTASEMTDEHAEGEIMETFQEHVGPSLRTLAVSLFIMS
jgi:hypothetical protein